MNRMMRSAVGAALVALVPCVAPAQESGNGLTGLQLSGDEPIQIESDRLDVRDREGVAIFTGNVSVVQGETLLKARRMTVHYTQDGDESASPTSGTSNIERLEATGKVYVESGNQVATGDQGTFDMKTEILTLTGEEVVLSEGDNVIVGCRLTAHMATGEAELEGCGNGEEGGRVRMLLSPESREDR